MVYGECGGGCGGGRGRSGRRVWRWGAAERFGVRAEVCGAAAHLVGRFAEAEAGVVLIEEVVGRAVAEVWEVAAPDRPAVDSCVRGV